MGEILALLGLDGLDTACVVCLKHDAGAIRRINERKPAAVALQVAKLIDEGHLIHAQKGCNGRNVLISQADIALPPAAGTAALASVNNAGFVKLFAHISHGLRVAFVICGGRT